MIQNLSHNSLYQELEIWARLNSQQCRLSGKLFVETLKDKDHPPHQKLDYD